MDGWGKVRRGRVDVHADRSRVTVAGARERERARVYEEAIRRKQHGDPNPVSRATEVRARSGSACTCIMHTARARAMALLWLCKRAPRNFGKRGKSNFRLNARGLESCTKPAHRATGWQAATSKVHRYRVHANVLRVPAAAGRSGLVQRTFHCSQQLEVEYVRGKPKDCIGKLSIVHTGRAARAGKALNSKYRCERSRDGEHVASMWSGSNT